MEHQIFDEKYLQYVKQKDTKANNNFFNSNTHQSAAPSSGVATGN